LEDVAPLEFAVERWRLFYRKREGDLSAEGRREGVHEGESRRPSALGSARVKPETHLLSWQPYLPNPARGVIYLWRATERQPKSHHRLDGILEICELDRFRKKGVRAKLVRPIYVSNLVRGCQDHCTQSGYCIILPAQPLQDLKAIRSRHFKVKEQQIRDRIAITVRENPVATQVSDGFGPGFDHPQDSGKGQLLEGTAQRQHVGFIILGDKDAMVAHSAVILLQSLGRIWGKHPMRLTPSFENGSGTESRRGHEALTPF
jgi:hypothetical protein